MSEDEEGVVPPQRCAAMRLTVYLVVEVVVAPELELPVAASLRYRAEEPFVVHLDSHVEQPEPVTWALSRDLLLAGLEGPAGMGDLTVRPGHGAEDGDVLLSLRGEGEDALLRMSAEELRSFLRLTECVVPVGCEQEHVDLNRLIGRLLGEE
ncbi:SsgA family sporulation/cell division regulator [Streptomyces sp. TLI_171]|uniref:SsgA family sporulation/cell division regulator n=1 Tax=Streptomyces sp. TLI_171 TaxID=1938859 RepID=UPI000C192E31|nr:SsgA family sporulation/cell division regulator [Streptomyces sp. TLI_171]